MSTPTFDDGMTFGQALRLARRRRGLTQREVGVEIGVSQATVSDWEKDAAVPRSTEYIAPLARFLERDEVEVERVLWAPGATVRASASVPDARVVITGPHRTEGDSIHVSLHAIVDRLSEEDAAAMEAIAKRLLGED